MDLNDRPRGSSFHAHARSPNPCNLERLSLHRLPAFPTQGEEKIKLFPVQSNRHPSCTLNVDKNVNTSLDLKCAEDGRAFEEKWLFSPLSAFKVSRSGVCSASPSTHLKLVFLTMCIRTVMWLTYAIIISLLFFQSR